MADDSGVRERLKEVRDALAAQVLFDEDSASWAVAAIDRFLAEPGLTLDAAFGLVVDRRSGRSLSDGDYAELAPKMWLKFQAAKLAPNGRTETAIAAEVGRGFGLGGAHPASEPDGSVASHFKRILQRYHQVIVDDVARRVGEACDRQSVKDADSPK